MKLKIFGAIFILLCVFAIDYFTRQAIAPEVQTSLALEQFKNPSTETDSALRIINGSNTISTMYVAWFVCVLFLFKNDIAQLIRMSKMKNAAALLPLLFIPFTGCVVPYHEQVLVDINTSEVAIMVETVNDNGQAVVAPKDKGADAVATDFYRNRLVNARKVLIPYYLKQTGRVRFWKDSTNTAWRPAARLIVVDTAPTSVQWDNDDPQMSIWVESSDSVGFSTGISVTARIDNQEDAITFLSNYPPEAFREVTTSRDSFKVEVTSLKQIINEELRSEIQDTYSYVSAGFTMDDLRDKKQYIIDIVKNGGIIKVLDPGNFNESGDPVYKSIEIEGVLSTFKARGVTITSLGQFGGFKYENPDIQKSIDKVFEAQQDEEVAKAEAKAAEQRKVALKLSGEGEAAKILEVKKGEAEGIKLVADAKSYEIEQLQKDPDAYLRLIQLEIQREQMKKWNGTLPKMVLGNSESLLLNIPSEE